MALSSLMLECFPYKDHLQLGAVIAEKWWRSSIGMQAIYTLLGNN